MSKEYSQHEIDRFFHQFKKMENSIAKEKVHQIINDPTAKARYRVRRFKNLNFIIMTFLISTSVVLALLYSTPEAERIKKTGQNSSSSKNEITVSENRTESNNPVTKTERQEVIEFVGNDAIQSEKSVAIGSKPIETVQARTSFSDTLIDGSKFILELSTEELQKIGFQIDHFTVFYRNSYKNSKVFYLATHSGGLMQIKGNSLYKSMEDYYELQTDKLPDLVPITQRRSIRKEASFDSRKSVRYDFEYLKSHHSFFPLFNTNQKGDIVAIDDKYNFEELADTLMPVVIKYPQLDSGIKSSQFFWFITNDDFYSKLPKRYAWVKQAFDELKSAKRQKGDKLDVDFKIEEWNKELLIADGLVLDGTDKIVQLTAEELKKIGILKRKKGVWSYCYRTPHRGSSSGLKSKLVNGRLQFTADTVFNVDYYVKYSTDCTGDFLSFSKSMRRIDGFFIENDVLLPVQVENKSGEIYWFTISEKLLDLLPERYIHLKAHYNKMLYNKSIHPERDFVKYFKDPFEKVGVSVKFLELTKEELRGIGFKFEDLDPKVVTKTSKGGKVERFNYKKVGAEISCGFGKSWIYYQSTDRWRFASKTIGPNAPRKNLPFSERVNYISPSRRFIRREWVEKFDSLYDSSNQGYLFVYVTDSLGRHMQKISLLQKDIPIAPDDFKYLIPVMVRQSKLADAFAEDRVFWFTPTKVFFDRLPDRIRDEIEAEYNIVSAEEQSTELSACTYFESCRSTLPVENMKVYPNPARNEITVDFNLCKKLSGIISIANVSGLQIKVLKDKTTFDQGLNSFHCDLSGITPGVYLVSIVTNEGFKTERIIVSE